jgi:hypothetical protein
MEKFEDIEKVFVFMANDRYKVIHACEKFIIDMLNKTKNKRIDLLNDYKKLKHEDNDNYRHILVQTFVGKDVLYSEEWKSISSVYLKGCNIMIAFDNGNESMIGRDHSSIIYDIALMLHNWQMTFKKE